MCGISGLVNKTISKDQLRLNINRMAKTMVHRGPDATNIYLKEYFALGHNRLSVQDLSSAGSQPMQLAKEGPVIVFNGEIYNFLDLREILQKKGCIFKSTSDTEVILFIYNVYGLKGFRMLEGIFSFALFIPNEKKNNYFKRSLRSETTFLFF